MRWQGRIGAVLCALTGCQGGFGLRDRLVYDECQPACPTQPAQPSTQWAEAEPGEAVVHAPRQKIVVETPACPRAPVPCAQNCAPAQPQGAAPFMGGANMMAMP